MRPLNVIDLFCGCGGFSKGFAEAWYNVRFGIDMWKDATVTYQHNFPNATVLNEDITKINGQDILNMTNMKADDVDVIIGGPPCQGFSVSGKRMIDDERNKLYKSYVQIVSELKPKVFVISVSDMSKVVNDKTYDNLLMNTNEDLRTFRDGVLIWGGADS